MDAHGNDIAQRFVDLSQPRKIEFLIRLMEQETVYIRVGFLSKTAQLKAIRNANERIHRFCGYVQQILGVHRYLDDITIAECVLELLGSNDAGLDNIMQVLDNLQAQ